MREMHRKLAIGLALLMVFSFGAATFARNAHAGTHGQKTPVVVVRAGTGEQGGTLHVQARVKWGKHPSDFSASATVHFASGDVSMDLTRHGKSFGAGANVPVAADETLGPVTVDFVVTYG